MMGLEPDTAEHMGFREYLLVLRRRWRLVFTFVVVAIAVTLGVSYASTPQYVATADVLIEPSGADVQASGRTEISSEEVATQAQVMTSLPVARLVQERYSLTALPDLSELVTVQAVSTSRILRVTAQDSQPDRAARTANTVATAYLQFRENDSIHRYEQARQRVSQEQTEIEARLDEVEVLIGRSDGPDQGLVAERRTLLTQLAQISVQLDALGDSLTTAAAGGELLQEAEPPETPVSPRTALNAVLGGLFGLLLGAGAALLRERFDDVVHDEDMVRRGVENTGAVMLGKIPRWPDQDYKDRLIALMEPHAPATEAYQRLGVNVRFLLATVPEGESSGAVVLATSGQEAEGKTVTACNLAVTAARSGMRTVVVDADLRRAAVAPRFGLGDPPGLSDLLAGSARVETFLLDVGVENLQILPAGTIPPNPAALLSSPKMRGVLAELSAEADVVIVDSPPVLTVADALELAHLADMVMVVTREGVSHRRQLLSVMESLRHIAVRSIGVVYNGQSDGARGPYYYTPRERSTHAVPGDLPSPSKQPLDDIEYLTPRG